MGHPSRHENVNHVEVKDGITSASKLARLSPQCSLLLFLRLLFPASSSSKKISPRNIPNNCRDISAADLKGSAPGKGPTLTSSSSRLRVSSRVLPPHPNTFPPPHPFCFTVAQGTLLVIDSFVRDHHGVRCY